MKEETVSNCSVLNCVNDLVYFSRVPVHVVSQIQCDPTSCIKYNHLVKEENKWSHS